MTSVHKPHDGLDTIGAGIFEEEDERQARFDREREQLVKLKEAARHVMSTAEGRRFVDWVLATTGLDESVTGATDRSMLYASAQRDLGLTYRSFLKEACPQQLNQMEEEADERRRNDA